MKNLLTGYAITILALSLLDGAGTIIHSLSTLAASSIDLKTAKNQLEIQKLVGEQEKDSGRVKAIGFAADLEGDEEEYDDDDP